jgi:hypothetical protein
MLGTVWTVSQPLLPTVFLSAALCICAHAQSAYVRVSQVGYEVGQSAHQ